MLLVPLTVCVTDMARPQADSRLSEISPTLHRARAACISWFQLQPDKRTAASSSTIVYKRKKKIFSSTRPLYLQTEIKQIARAGSCCLRECCQALLRSILVADTT